MRNDPFAEFHRRRAENDRWWRRWVLTGIVINLCLLAVLGYVGCHFLAKVW